MDYPFFGTLFLLGFSSGLLSGLVGIGGGIILFPLLLYLPPALGLASLSVKTAAAITAVQSFFGALSGAYAHHRHKQVDWALSKDFGGAMAASSFLGSILSRDLPEHFILALFALLALIAAALMLIPRPEQAEPEIETPFHYSRRKAWILGAAIGIAAGVIGQGGGFLFVPVLMAVLHAPVRRAIGTALAVGVLSSAAVVLGRVGTAQIPWAYAAIAVSGGLIGAQIGSELSQRLPRQVLRRILAAAIFLTAIKMLWGLLG